MVVVIVDVDVGVLVVSGGIAVVVGCIAVIVVDTDTVDVVVIVVNSDFFGTKTTNFNTRERVRANIVTIIKDIQAILIQRWCHHLPGLIFFATCSLYNWL